MYEMELSIGDIRGRFEKKTVVAYKVCKLIYRCKL